MTPDEASELMVNGSRAAALMPMLQQVIAELHNSIVDRQVRLYNGGQLSPELALAGWGEVAALDKLLEKAGKDIQKAAAARRQMNGRETEPTE